MHRSTANVSRPSLAAAVGLGLLLGVGVAISLPGCESEIEPEGGRAAAETKPEPTRTTGDLGRTSTSSLGKAKQGAENVVNQLEERDRELQKQMEGDGG